MDNYSIQITNYLLTQSWQIALLVVVVAAVTLLLKNKSAHVRYLLWLVVLAKCLVPPLLTVPLPVLPDERVMIVLTPNQPVAVEPVEASTPEAPASSAPAAAKHTPRMTARQWLAVGWIIGAGLFGLVAVAKALRTELWLRRVRRLLPAGLRSEIEELFSGLGVRISPKLWLVEGIGQPFVWGLLRGSIYLPGNFTKVDVAEHRRGILGHELSHILRFDAAVNLLQVMAQALFWFHPFVWWANKKIRAEREKCCDEMVIARLGAKVKDYSSAIVNILVSESESIRPVPSLAVAGPVKNIEERIKTMLRPGKKFYKHPSLPAATVVVLTALLAVPTAVVLTVRAENQASTKGQDADLVFSNPANLGPTVNSSDTENDPGISADGLSLYFNSYRPGGLGSAEIWVTTRKTKADPWGTPVNLGPMVNSSANENAPSLSADGLSLYFGSDRPGGYGGRDLWVTTRKTTTDAWAEPVNLGPVVNTSAHEHGPSISSDGLSLYFSEYAWTPPFRPGGIGGGDLWVTTRKTKVDPWTTPVNLGPIVNSSWWDASPSISTDGLSLYFNSNRPGGFGDTDLWVTTRKTKGDPWGTPVNLGPTVNSAVRDYNPDICADGSTLYFASKRSGAIGGSDDSDIWQVSLKPEAKLGKSLHDAAADGDIEKVRSLISKGADVNAKNQDGLTPLHLAARFGRENMVELLISKGANVDVKDERGRAPIIFAVWGKHKETIKLLLAKGADVNTTMIAFDAPGASRPLHEAIYDGNLDIAKLLIANGADVNAAGEFSWTPLHCAVACGDRDLVELLLAKGSIGPVFHVAACKGDLGGVKRLLAQGRNVDEKDEQDCTPLYWSVATGQKEVVEFLLTSGADVNMRNGTGDAPLHRAIRHKKPRRDIVELLIAKGADVNMRSGWGGTYQRGMVPLHFAAIGGQKELVEMLLRNGADVSAKDGNGATALHYAVENAHKQIVEVLLANGADVDAKYRNGRTSLDEAAEHGYRDVAELLISKGANVNAKSNSGKTALTYAKEKAHTEIVELLRKHGAKE